MINPKYIFAIFIFLSGQFVTAQDIRMSQEFNMRVDNSFSLIGEIKDTVFLFKEKSLDYGLEVFNSKLELLFEKELFFEKEKVRFNALLPGEKDFTIIYSYDSKFDLNLRANKYDLKGNLIDSILLYEEKEFLEDNDFMFLTSDNENKVLLFRESRYNELEFILFDLQSYENLWYKKYKFDDYRINQHLNGILLNDDGLIILAFEKNNQAFRKKKHLQEMVFIDPFTDEFIKYKIPFNGELSVSFNFELDLVRNEIIVAGLYGSKSSSRADGYYLYKMNKSGVFQPLVFKKFSIDLLIKHKGRQKNPKNYIPDLVVQDLIIRNDGGVLLLSEMQKKVARENVRRRYIDYHFEDMVLLSIHPDGELFWDDLIRKYQLSFDDGARYSSYFLFKTPSRLSIIFNDEIKSENTISEYSIDPLGNGIRKSLFSTDLHRLLLLFEEALQVSSNEFIVPSVYNNKYRLIKLTF